jgi:hypothetical protein
VSCEMSVVCPTFDDDAKLTLRKPNIG